MTRIVSFMAGLAIIATAGAAQAQNAFVAGAPGGTSGGAIDFDQSAILDTGIATADIYGTGGTGTGDYTFSAWINPDQATAESWFAGTTNEAFHFGILENPAGDIALRQGHWGSDSSGGTAIVADDWVHATLSYDADGGTNGTVGLASIYLNGALNGSADINAPNNTNGNFVIGGRIRNDSAGEFTGLNRQPWDGQIDDVAIFDAALSATQIADLASGAQGALALGANAFYDFEDDQTGVFAASQGALGSTLNIVTGVAVAVPEPSSLAFLACIGVAGLVRRKRS